MTAFAASKKDLMRQNMALNEKSERLDMQSVASIILGGGEGTRLYPLTLTRCKPAISFGGKYRLVDVPISNSINAGCHKIFVLTQFLSASLHRHVYNTYYPIGLPSGFIEILSAEQKPKVKEWYQGTADAVRQNMEYFLDAPVDYFLILSGDQLYNIDFREMLRFAEKTDADVVIASLPVTSQDASRMGVLKVDDQDFIVEFHEKPQDASILKRFRSPEAVLKRVSGKNSADRCYLASMGIYLFKRQALIDLLKQDPREDFGKHLIPTKVAQGGVAAYLYNGYWEDVGTIETYYQANMALTVAEPVFDTYNSRHPIYSRRQDVPPAKISGAQVTQSIICDGAIVECDEVTRSILGPRSVVKKGSIIRDSYLIGNDFYQPPAREPKKLPPRLHIGENCIIKKAIVDKNVQIGDGVQLINKKKLVNYDGDNIYIRDGIIIVPTGANIPDGFIL